MALIRKQGRTVLACEKCGASTPVSESEDAFTEAETWRLDCPLCLSELDEDKSTAPSPSAPVTPPREIYLVDEPLLSIAETYLNACEFCEKESQTPFDYILDELTGAEPTETQYLFCRPAHCPQCQHTILEKTLVFSVTR